MHTFIHIYKHICATDQRMVQIFCSFLEICRTHTNIHTQAHNIYKHTCATDQHMVQISSFFLDTMLRAEAILIIAPRH